MKNKLGEIGFTKKVFFDFAIAISGIFIMAFAFNAFYKPNSIVSGGISGLSIAISSLNGINPTTFIIIVNILLITLGIAALGIKPSIKTIIGTVAFSLFIYITQDINKALDFGISELFLNVIIGSVLLGTGSGIVYKKGYNSGGVDVIALIIAKYANVSVGKAERIINGLIIAVGLFVFGITLAIYSVIAIIIKSMLIDRIILGISDSKMFIIVTEKETEVIQYIKEKLSANASIMKGKNMHNGKEKNMILCIISTHKYCELKKAVQEIDNEAFLVVTDCYEVLGGDTGDVNII